MPENLDGPSTRWLELEGRLLAQRTMLAYLMRLLEMNVLSDTPEDRQERLAALLEAITASLYDVAMPEAARSARKAGALDELQRMLHPTFR